jgi:predicted nucleic acid-binding protein
VFLDTSGWFAALSPREAFHAACAAAYRSWLARDARLVTTNLVLAEMQILIARYRDPATAIRFLDAVHQDSAHDVVYVDRDTERAATDRWLRRFADQRISLTDAVSFEVMRTRRIRRALALDEHFALAGFEAMPSRG